MIQKNLVVLLGAVSQTLISLARTGAKLFEF
jgi:hypothetical protein